MEESYTDLLAGESGTRAPGAAAVAEPGGPSAHMRDVIAQLLPGYNAERVLQGLFAERDAQRRPAGVSTPLDLESESSTRELARLRHQLALGASVHSLQHAFNNPLTALLAEVQLLELEPLSGEQRATVRRIVDLTRRLVAVSRRLGSV